MPKEIQILHLLSEKRQLFLELETVTSAMCFQQADQIVESMDRRSRLITQIDTLDETLAQLTADRPLLQDALSNRCDRQDLDEELAEVYDAALAVKAVVNRLLRNDGMVREHLEFEKQRALQGVEEMNRSGPSVADRYHRSVQTAVQPSEFSRRDTKI